MRSVVAERRVSSQRDASLALGADDRAWPTPKPGNHADEDPLSTASAFGSGHGPLEGVTVPIHDRTFPFLYFYVCNVTMVTLQLTVSFVFLSAESEQPPSREPDRAWRNLHGSPGIERKAADARPFGTHGDG